MKSYSIKYCILSLATLIGCSVNSHSSVYWDEFLKQTNKDSYIELQSKISKVSGNCTWGSSKNHEVISVEVGQQLYKLIAEGNEFAFRAGLLVMSCLDGGELGDFHRSVGLFFEAEPQIFLKIAQENKIPDTTIERMLIMLPLDTVDNIDYAINIIEKRIVVLDTISNSQFDHIKKVGLSFLKNQKEMLERIKKEN